MTDRELIIAIQELLNGSDRNPTLLSYIADMLTDNGYPVETQNNP